MRLANWGKIVGIVVLILASAAVAAEMAGVGGDLPSATVRYKMTVNVDTPEGVKTGSAVREIRPFQTPSIPDLPGSGGVEVDFKGEAVVVDLGERGKFFAIMSNARSGPDYNYAIFFKSFPLPGLPKGAGAQTTKGIHYYQTLKSGSKILEPEDYPDMVMFRDINDPKTVEPVWMGELYQQPVGQGSKTMFRVRTDDFEKRFGTGVKLKNVTIEITQEAVTKGIEKDLPWLPEYYNKMLDGKRYNTIYSKLPLANSLASGDFSTGENDDNE